MKSLNEIKEEQHKLRQLEKRRLQDLELATLQEKYGLNGTAEDKIEVETKIQELEIEKKTLLDNQGKK